MTYERIFYFSLIGSWWPVIICPCTVIIISLYDYLRLISFKMYQVIHLLEFQHDYDHTLIVFIIHIWKRQSPPSFRKKVSSYLPCLIIFDQSLSVYASFIALAKLIKFSQTVFAAPCFDHYLYRVAKIKNGKVDI